jgi:hypothetical protein
MQLHFKCRDTYLGLYSEPKLTAQDENTELIKRAITAEDNMELCSPANTLKNEK